MANYYRKNVIHVDTNGYTLAGNVYINSARYIAGTGTRFQVRGDAASDGPVLYEVDGASDNYDENLCIQAVGGIYVEVTGSDADLYLYLK